MSIVHACKKFHPYIFGKEVTLYNDHRPLEQILKKAAPMRLKGMILNFQWYDLIVKYCKGKEMYLTDTLLEHICLAHLMLRSLTWNK